MNSLESLLFFKCPRHGTGNRKSIKKINKNKLTDVLIAGKSELKVTVIFPLLILLLLHIYSTIRTYLHGL